jgi:thioesterase domain-containing protein
MPLKARSIVGLRAAGTIPPLYAIPGVFRNVVGFSDLARELGSDQPFYGLQSVGLDGTEAPLDSIDEIAKLYVNEARSVHPGGPYAIIGACFGATVAYEMARQLLEEGEEVAFLGLLGPTDREGKGDSENSTSIPRACRRTWAFGNPITDRLNLYLEEMQQLSIRDRVKYLKSKALSLATSIGVKQGFLGAQRELNQIEVYRANLVALDCYHRKSLHGRLRALEVFQPVRPGTDVQEPIDWNEFWKGCTKVHRVGGQDSGDMLSGKNVRVMAALLKERLIAAFADEFGPVRRIKEAKQELTPTSPRVAG